MATPKKEKIIEANLSDKDMVEQLSSRGIVVPMSEDGRLMRGPAADLLKASNAAIAAKDELERKVRVIFHRSNNPNANENYVFLSLNDRSMQAPYETEVSIPKKYLTSCIDMAQVVEHVMDGGKIVERRVNIYPYTLLGYEDEMNAE